MKQAQKTRYKLLSALLNFAEKSGNFNPHFYKKEMMELLKITEGEFNIIQKNLGDKYCYYVDSHGGGERYAINVSECLALQEQYERHKQLVLLAVLVAMFGAILGAAFSIWFSK